LPAFICAVVAGQALGWTLITAGSIAKYLRVLKHSGTLHHTQLKYQQPLHFG
jgi:hypothetical protein